MSDPITAPTLHVADAYPAQALRVISGANLGDMLEEADLLCPGDVYRLTRAARMQALHVSVEQGAAQVAEGATLGLPGDCVAVQARLRFMASTGRDATALLIALGVPDMGGALCLLPLHGLEAGQDLTLIGIDPVARDGLQDLPSRDLRALGIARDTRVSRGDGRLVPVQELRPGDTVLTRDSGAQPILSIQSRTVPATGPETPIVIAAGRLGNPATAILAPQQRVFFYQHAEARLTETAEILLRAGALTGTRDVARRPGGYVEYFVLVLAAHEILYVEGIPCESLELSAEARNNLPAALSRAVDQATPGLQHAPHLAEEADEAMAAAMARALLG